MGKHQEALSQLKGAPRQADPRRLSTSCVRQAFDLGAHQAFDPADWSGLEHRPDEFADHLLDRAAAAHLRRLGERVESSTNRGGGRGRKEAVLVDGGGPRSRGGRGRGLKRLAILASFCQNSSVQLMVVAQKHTI